MSRRGLLIGGALALAWVIGAPRLIRLTQPEFAFEDVPGLPGFRSLGLGRGPGNIALLGIGDTVPEPPRDPCAAIFGAGDGRLPVAVFTDYFCGYCPAVSDLVRRLDREGVIRAVWREWPVLGPRSEALARVALAAAEQGGHDAVHAHLMRAGLRPGPAALAELAARFNLDANRLQRAAASPAVSERIATTRTLAKQLGLPGTPGIAIGRTLTAGAITEDRLRRLVALEAERGGCTA
ncbi:MAG: DsbA family protein [Pseudooceanicola sp.]|nr:DsbA family protein [Pseudooceanicola sp.]